MPLNPHANELPAEDSAAREPLPRASAPQRPAKKARTTKILRFAKSERLLHWAIAAPFLTCYSTALILVIFYNPDPLRPYRIVFSTIHRTSGVCLIVLPFLAAYHGRGDARLHLYNIKQAWTWGLEDIKWLFLMLGAALSSRIKLPDQGKFNAAEKINFIVLLGTYPFYVLTGLLIWLTDSAFVSWLMHAGMAMLATPLILGHMYMALLSKSGRPGLSGMKNGYVDREWARHHYAHWYREHFGTEDEAAAQDRREPEAESPDGARPAGTE